jgi:hypothetical protein
MLSCRLQQVSALPLTTHSLVPTSSVLSSSLKMQRRKKKRKRDGLGSGREKEKKRMKSVVCVGKWEREKRRKK